MKDIVDIWEKCVKLEKDASDESDRHLTIWDRVQEDPEMLTVKINESGAMSYYQGRIDAIREIKRFIRGKEAWEE